jgi:glucosamine--fructose-6-phosphate aminotransferase (isomerizing)
MCGIVGYIGNKQALPILLQGLRDLEYRGYDSAGIALLEHGKIVRVRAVGKVDNLAKKLHGEKFEATEGIAHTRWATHGGVAENNAHPHFGGDGKLVLAHNGIIENYREIKNELEKEGAVFSSETDTEVLAHLIAKIYNQSEKKDLVQAVRKGLLRVRGTYGIAVMHEQHPGLLVAARLGSPLVIGIGEVGEYFLASDVTPMLPFTKQVSFLDDGEIAEISAKGLKIANLRDEVVEKNITQIEWNKEQAQKGGFEHFMLKEIFDQPTVFEDAIRGRLNIEEGTAVLGGLNLTTQQMHGIKRIVIIAEGTARHAGLIAKYAFERLANLPCEVDFSSEFRYRDPIVDENTLIFAISQSGETVDTLLALREGKRKGAMVRGIINSVGSSIARETKAGTYIHAGPELSVASTKAFTNMVAVLLLYALQFGRLKHTSVSTGQRLLKALLEVPEKMSTILSRAEEIKKIAEKYFNYKNMVFVSRGVNYPVALEGALKLKEISYIHAEGMGSGEMKHGSLAIISSETPLVVIMTQNSLYDKVKSNVQEAKSRGAKIIAIATEGDMEVKEISDDVIYVPKTMELLEPLLNTIPLQLFAYHMAVLLGRDVDRPRNLAKSVTVE